MKRLYWVILVIVLFASPQAYSQGDCGVTLAQLNLNRVLDTLPVMGALVTGAHHLAGRKDLIFDKLQAAKKIQSTATESDVLWSEVLGGGVNFIIEDFHAVERRLAGAKMDHSFDHTQMAYLNSALLQGDVKDACSQAFPHHSRTMTREKFIRALVHPAGIAAHPGSGAP